MTIDRSKITVTMSMEDYNFYREAVESEVRFIKMLKRANKDGIAIMTEELKMAIEEIYC